MGTFLIADDSKEKIFMLRRYLKMAGWQGEVLTAMTCDEAYAAIAAAEDLSAAFIDYYIPEDNGPEIIKRIKTKFPACRVALVSSADNAANAAQARTAGAEAVLCTSYRSDQVESSVLELLHQWMEEG